MKPGDKVGRYKLGEQIGEGAMAQVFASSHPVFERTLAIKVLKKEACWDASFVARFLDDARSAHGLDHPNIVRVLDVDDTGDQPFIVMELIDGAALDVWLEGRQLEVAEAARIARDVASALAAAHGAGMVHRDVKPSNVLIDRATGLAKLTDFGAAKRDRPGAQQLTEMGQRIGTPRYMAPEQVEGGKVDARTDLFALGATLYELLAGRPAFEGDNLAAIYHAILFGQPHPLAELRPDAPPELVQLVERLLAREPGARPDSAAEVAAALAPFAGVAAGANGTVTPSATVMPAAGVTPSGATMTPGDPPSQPAAGGPQRGGDDRARDATRTPPPAAATTRRRPAGLMPLAGLAAVLLVAVGLGAWWLWPGEPEPVAVVPAEPETAALEPVPAEPEAEPAAPAPLPATAAPEPVAPEPAAAPAPPPEQAEPAPTPPETETETAALPPPPTAPEAAPEPAPPAEPELETAALPPPTEPVPGAPAPVTLDCPDPAAAPGCNLAAQALSVLTAPAAPPPLVSLNRPDGVYLDQDHFVAEVELPDELGGYLYLDLITDNGTVIHLLPEPLREDNALPAGGEIRVGVEERERREGVRHWQVSGPFGEGYLLATVSENRLYEGLRPIEEPIADYQDVLLEALLDPATGRKTAQVERLEFRPRG